MFVGIQKIQSEKLIRISGKVYFLLLPGRTGFGRGSIPYSYCHYGSGSIIVKTNADLCGPGTLWFLAFKDPRHRGCSPLTWKWTWSRCGVIVFVGWFQDQHVALINRKILTSGFVKVFHLYNNSSFSWFRIRRDEKFKTTSLETFYKYIWTDGDNVFCFLPPLPLLPSATTAVWCGLS